MSSNRTVRVGVVQTLAELGDVDANIDIARGYIAQAADQGVQLLVFPECMNTGYLFDDATQCRQVAETLEGPFVSELKSLAQAHAMHIASGVTELDPEDGLVYNSLVLIGPGGNVVGHYRKQFLATHDFNWFTVGNKGCVTVDTELGRLGLLICFDGRIPEIARSISLSGAELVVDVANFFDIDQADQWVPARAYENGVWIAAATKSGVERSIYYPGGSMIAAPDGTLAAKVARDSHGLGIADIDLGLARDKSWPTGGDRFADRRPEHYTVIGEPTETTPVATQLVEPIIPGEATAMVAAVQAHAIGGERESLSEALQMVEHTARLGAKVLSLPLHFAIGSPTPSLAEVVEAQAGQAEAQTELSRICKTYQAVVVFPQAHPIGDGSYEVGASVIGIDGEEMAWVPQVHPEPSGGFQSGAPEGFKVIATPYGVLGVLVGYDGMFPESARVLALKGAEVLVWTAAWSDKSQRDFLTVTKAEDNRCYLVAANRTDGAFSGGSLVVSPQGLPHWSVEHSVPTNARHGAVMPAFANLALARQKSLIPGVDVIRRRIPSAYGPIVAPVEVPVA